MSQRLQLKLLGVPRILLSDEPVNGFISSKAEALLFYLAVTDRRHARSTLATLLWGNSSESAARNSLNKAISNLRKLVGDYLDIDRSTVAWCKSNSEVVDPKTFETQIDRALQHGDMERLSSLLELYRGDFLEGFYVADALAFDDWMTSERTRLCSLRVSALERQLQHYVDDGQLQSAIDSANRLLQVEPWHESVHCQLMALLAQNGQRSSALAQFQVCCDVLADELSVEPAPETTALFEQIRAGEFPQGHSTQQHKTISLPVHKAEALASKTASDSAIPPHNLPSQVTPLIGREREQIELRHLLADPTTRLLTIMGPGGIGKSHLALAVAHQTLHPQSKKPTIDEHESYAPTIQPSCYFPDGIYFVELASVSSPTAIVTAIADALQIHLSSTSDLQKQLVNCLHTKTLLLILDNFEHLVDDADLLAALLKNCPSLKIIVTSRVRLRMQSEQLFVLDGLAFPPEEHEASATLLQYSSVDLFLLQARRGHLHFAPSDEDWHGIANLCRMMEGMPLGILLAAVWVKFYSPTKIFEEIQESLALLTVEWQDVPARHRSICAAFEHSWRLLHDQEKSLFQRLAVFRDGFTTASVEAVTGVITDAAPQMLLALGTRIK